MNIYYHFLFSLILFLTIHCQENIKDLKDDVNSKCTNSDKKINPALTMGYFTPW